MPKKSDNSPKEEKKVLDLLDDSKKPSRRQRQKIEADVATAPSKLDAAKANALDLFAEEQKPKVRKKAPAGKNVIGSISKILDKEAQPEAVEVTPEPAPVIEAAETIPAQEVVESDDPLLIVIKPPILVHDLAARLGLKPFNVMADLIKLGVFPAPNQPLEPDVAAKVCEIHGFTFEREKRDKDKGFHKVDEVIVEPEAPAVEPEDLLKERPPIVTIMGHVDHGKTSILDYYRKSKVVSGEAGGITQHIGAYQVNHNGQLITFLDTPGHAIFSDMRKRGASITDIAIIVVAANDGIMPQTSEAIKHAQKAKKTIIVAINKCDLPSANVERVKAQLAENGLQTTDYGGDTEFATISALKGEGMDDLLELIVLQAEVLELRANPKATTRAGVIEARLIRAEDQRGEGGERPGLRHQHEGQGHEPDCPGDRPGAQHERREGNQPLEPAPEESPGNLCRPRREFTTAAEGPFFMRNVTMLTRIIAGRGKQRQLHADRCGGA